MSKKIRNEAETQTQHAEWKVVASVLDRLFFVTYLALIVLSLAFLFPWPVWTQLHLHAYILTRTLAQSYQGNDTRLNTFMNTAFKSINICWASHDLYPNLIGWNSKHGNLSDKTKNELIYCRMAWIKFCCKFFWNMEAIWKVHFLHC